MENFSFSIDRYLLDNYSTTKVKYQNMPGFDKETEGEWIEPQLLNQVGIPARTSQEHNQYLFIIDCFSYVDTDAGAAANRRDLRRIDAIVDGVLAIFEKKDINYQTSAGQNLGWLRCREATVRDISDEETLRVKSVEIPITLIRSI